MFQVFTESDEPRMDPSETCTNGHIYLVAVVVINYVK
jgi:hypothetical protein